MLGHQSSPNGAFTRAAASNLDTFTRVVQRLEAALDAESDALHQNKPCDLADLCTRKRQGLLELTRIMPGLATSDAPEQTRDRLGTLAIKLERNRLVLDVQLRAVGEVADIIARTMKEADSDGTYSMLPVRP